MRLYLQVLVGQPSPVDIRILPIFDDESSKYGEFTLYFFEKQKLLAITIQNL